MTKVSLMKMVKEYLMAHKEYFCFVWWTQNQPQNRLRKSIKKYKKPVVAEAESVEENAAEEEEPAEEKAVEEETPAEEKMADEEPKAEEPEKLQEEPQPEPEAEPEEASPPTVTSNGIILFLTLIKQNRSQTCTRSHKWEVRAI